MRDHTLRRTFSHNYIGCISGVRVNAPHKKSGRMAAHRLAKAIRRNERQTFRLEIEREFVQPFFACCFEWGKGGFLKPFTNQFEAEIHRAKEEELYQEYEYKQQLEFNQTFEVWEDDWEYWADDYFLKMCERSEDWQAHQEHVEWCKRKAAKCKAMAEQKRANLERTLNPQPAGERLYIPSTLAEAA